MSTSNSTASNPSPAAGRPETSGWGETRERQQEHVNLAVDRLTEVLSATSLCLMALRECPPDDFADSTQDGSGAPLAFFRSDDGALRLDRLDWQSIISALDAPIHQVLKEIGVVVRDETGEWAFDWLLAGLDLCEGMRAWLQSTSFHTAPVERAARRSTLQVMEMFAREIDGLIRTWPVCKVIN